MKQVLKDRDLGADAEILRALAHGVRLELMRTIALRERSVGEIESATGIGQPGLSQQLAILRKADLVQTRREAKQIFYRINRRQLAEINDLIVALADTATNETGRKSEPRPSAKDGGIAMFARIERT